eukprot:CAMPEP_0194335510 /NCGR_PEP_ID=MMETSP0171-20130528/69846_1 /TAXON_ID=218684 /ORGANISM="Corethron pennatum, Strain L29A3" /LENGTH=125 /DNA_ID=CAMNT_0039098629 /DNA_START=223 /DNA_END=597 /DNA_ORIENTATION=+
MLRTKGDLMEKHSTKYLAEPSNWYRTKYTSSSGWTCDEGWQGKAMEASVQLLLSQDRGVSDRLQSPGGRPARLAENEKNSGTDGPDISVPTADRAVPWTSGEKGRRSFFAHRNRWNEFCDTTGSL